MSQVRLIKFKFKSGGKQFWLDWCEQLKARTDEVMETLKNEGVLTEANFISQDGQELYYFMEAEDLEKVKAAVKNSPYKIDQEHRQAREVSLEKIEELQPIFYFQNKFGKH